MQLTFKCFRKKYTYTGREGSIAKAYINDKANGKNNTLIGKSR